MTLPAPPAGKARYLISGLAFAFLIGAVMRAFGRLAGAGGIWRGFSGECLATELHGDKTALLVRFQDANGLSHRAAFLSAHPAAQALVAGDIVHFSVALSRWRAGTLPGELPHAQEAGRDILLRAECRSVRLRAFGREFLRQALTCGAALAVFLLAMHWCFPA